jgi:hypothetical protein
VAQCITPWHVSTKFGTKIPVPCGKCPPCIQRAVNGWAFRMMVQQRDARTSLFVTLTYDTNFVPVSTGKAGAAMSLQKTDVQKFLKRLRKLHENQDIKYFAVGEYGTKPERPHYHAIIFNANPEHIERAWALDNKKIGDIFIGTCTEASIVYTLKYMCKHTRITKQDPYNRQREFRLMSKGMGQNYITEKMSKWHKQDLVNRCYLPLMDGKKVAMPRYYKERLYNEKERKLIGISQQIKFINEENEEREKIGNVQYEINEMNKKEAIINKYKTKSNNRQKI